MHASSQVMMKTLPFLHDFVALLFHVCAAVCHCIHPLAASWVAGFFSKLYKSLEEFVDEAWDPTPILLP